MRKMPRGQRPSRDLVNYINETGHAIMIRTLLRRLPERDAVEGQRALDALIERAIEVARVT
jgi:Holliday junction resolvase